MQALYLLALDPVAESTADPNSYGFRKDRSTADAIAQLSSKEIAIEETANGLIYNCNITSPT